MSATNVKSSSSSASSLVMMCLCAAGLSLSVAACGDNKPPPKTEETAKEDDAAKTRKSGGGPSVAQELGSIDQREVEQTFSKLQGKVESCIKKGRDRVEYMSGEMKVFLRIDGEGKVKYSFFDESTMGDRETEKCILDIYGGTAWPKPQGGEAEVRTGFGFPAGGERQPANWSADKVALDDDTKKAVEKCKSGVSGDFRITAYVEPGEPEGSEHGSHAGDGKSSGKGGAKGGGAGATTKKNSKKGDKKGPSAAGAHPKSGEHGGKFKTIGIAPPGKDGAEKIDCIVDAIKNSPLPSPGSYVAKVTFTL